MRNRNAVPIALIAPRFPRRRMFLICTIGTAAVSQTAWTIFRLIEPPVYRVVRVRGEPAISCPA